MALHTKILLGLFVGAVAGGVTYLTVGTGPRVLAFVTNVTEPIGQVWLNALIMVVIPLVLSTLAVGVAGLGSLSRFGRIAGLTMATFLSLTTIAALLGLTLVHIVRPGAGLDPAVRASLMETYKGQSDQQMGFAQSANIREVLLKIVPRNPIQAAATGEMLAVIFVAIMIGVALTMLPRDRARPLVEVLESVAHVTIAVIGLVMKVAPYAVACLIYSVIARFGFDILVSLAQYVGLVIGGLVLFVAVVYPLTLKFVAGRRPMEFFHHAWIVIVTAFSTSSSNATLPTTLRVTEEKLGVPNEVAGFVVPLGATMNMNGTALFEGVTVLFLAQVFGVDLSLGQQVIVIAMAVIVAIGAAGVPGGSIPLLMMVMGMVGVPMEGIAIVLGVDRILDMSRTTVNVIGDMITSTVVYRYSGVKGGTILEGVES